MVMVPFAEPVADGTLLGRLGAVAAALGQKVQAHAQRVHPGPPCADAERQQPGSPAEVCSRSFELADHLECGTGPGLASRFVQPAAVREVQSFLVRVSEDMREHTLTTEGGRRLLIARTVDTDAGVEIHIFAACGGAEEKDAADGPAPGPDFRLKANASGDTWSLHIARCEHCESRCRRQCGTRELARMLHHSEAIGDSEAFCMDVELPEYAEGSPGGRCQVCGACPVERVAELTSRRPWWDEGQQTLRLSFHGRCNRPSERNFQLEAPGGSRRAPAKLLFGERSVDSGKLLAQGTKLFVLDHSEPLGTVQAFAAALTTVKWM